MTSWKWQHENDIMTMTHNNDKGPRKEGRRMTKGRKEDYKGKEVNWGKEGNQQRDGRKIIKNKQEKSSYNQIQQDI